MFYGSTIDSKYFNSLASLLHTQQTRVPPRYIRMIETSLNLFTRSVEKYALPRSFHGFSFFRGCVWHLKLLVLLDC